MADNYSSSKPIPWWRSLNTLAIVLFLAIAAFFLFTEHRAHLYGALPYLFVLVCFGLLLAQWRIYRTPPGGPVTPPSRRSVSGKGGTSNEP